MPDSCITVAFAARLPDLGVRAAEDSEAPPGSWASCSPWGLTCGLLAAYALGKADWHWCYLVALFWVVSSAEERRCRRVWADLKAAAFNSVAEGAKLNESAMWLNQLLRAVWPMYESGVANYFRGYMQPVLSGYGGSSISGSVMGKIDILQLNIKQLCFGAISERAANSGGREQQLAPIHFSNVRMISKAFDVASRDPSQHRVKYVLQTDVRYVSGDKGTFVLDMSLGPKWVAKVFSLKLDAVVKELVLTGSVRLLGP